MAKETSMLLGRAKDRLVRLAREVYILHALEYAARDTPASHQIIIEHWDGKIGSDEIAVLSVIYHNLPGAGSAQRMHMSYMDALAREGPTSDLFDEIRSIDDRVRRAALEYVAVPGGERRRKLTPFVGHILGFGNNPDRAAEALEKVNAAALKIASEWYDLSSIN